MERKRWINPVLRLCAVLAVLVSLCPARVMAEESVGATWGVNLRAPVIGGKADRDMSHYSFKNTEAWDRVELRSIF